MLTQTTKQILQPVAEAISALIVINAEVEANQAMFPDLTDVAAVVDSQAKNLVDIGMSMLAGGDDLMRKEMPPACDEITASSKSLVEASLLLKKDARSKEGRSKLVDGCKGILQGTTTLLDAYDDSEVRKIVAICEQSKEHISRLKDTLEVQAMIAVMRPTCQLLVDLTALCTRRVDEMLVPALQQRLRDGIAQISNSSSLVITSCKAVAQNSSNSQVVESRALILAHLVKIIVDIEVVIQIRDWSDASYTDVLGKLAGNRQDIDRQLAEIMSHAQEGKKPELDSTIEAFQYTSDWLDNQALEISRSTKQKESQAKLIKLTDDARQTKARLLKMAQKVVNDPKSIDSQKELYEELRHANMVYRSIAVQSDAAVASDLLDAIGQLKDHTIVQSAIGQYYTLCNTEDYEGFSNAQSAVLEEYEKLNTVLDQTALLSPDADTFRGIRSAQNDLKDIIEQVRVTGDALASKPNDKNLQEHFNAVIKTWEDRVQKLEKDSVTSQAVFKAGELISSDMLSLQSRFADLDQGIAQKNKIGIIKAVNGVLSSLQRMVDLAKREMENTNDPVYKSKLQAQLVGLEKSLVAARATADKLYSNPEDAAALEMFKNQQASLQKASTDLVDVMRPEKLSDQTHSTIPEPSVAPIIIEAAAGDASGQPVSNDDEVHLSQLDLQFSVEELNQGPQITEINGEEVEVVSTPAPEPLSEEEARLNPIKAAAQDLKVQAAQYSAVQNPVVELMQALALKMELIGMLYKENTSQSKSSLMKNVQGIQVDISDLLKHAKAVLENCTDKSLKLQLQQSMERMQTLSVQLKIVAAVKIAEQRDTDSEKQLVLCSQNLMAATRSMLRSCEACSLRSIKTTANVAVAAIKFRKVLFKKGGLRQNSQKAGLTGALANAVSSGVKASPFKPVSLTSGVVSRAGNK